MRHFADMYSIPHKTFRKNLMRIPVARLKSCRSLLLLCGGALALCQPLRAQSEDKELQRLDRRIGNLIRSIDEIKWQYISIYHLEDEFKSFLLKRQQAEDSLDLAQIDMVGQTLCDEPLPA